MPKCDDPVLIVADFLRDVVHTMSERKQTPILALFSPAKPLRGQLPHTGVARSQRYVPTIASSFETPQGGHDALNIMNIFSTKRVTVGDFASHVFLASSLHALKADPSDM
jgi:hypothetical protein